MPIHDWTRVTPGIFHHFHQRWISALADVLNAGLLPPDYYALGEQIAGRLGPDVLTLQTPASEGNGSRHELEGAVAVAVVPPPVRFTLRAEVDVYALKRRTVVIRHSSNHRVVAL